MSRLIVKNLPKHINSDRLKEHFSEKGVVTDVKLNYTKDGVFRRFGFIGFKTAAEAADAQKYFDQTYIDTSKIHVEFAKSLNDSEIPRAWSKYSEGSSAFAEREERFSGRHKVKQEKETKKAREAQKEAMARKKEKAQKLLKELYGDIEDDAKFKEFMEVSKARKDTQTWANDDTALKLTKDSETKESKHLKFNDNGLIENKKKKAADVNSDSDESEDEEEYQEIEVEPVKEIVPEEKDSKMPTMSNLDYLRSKGVDMEEDNNNDDSSEDSEEETDSDEEETEKQKQKREKRELKRQEKKRKKEEKKEKEKKALEEEKDEETKDKEESEAKDMEIDQDASVVQNEDSDDQEAEEEKKEITERDLQAAIVAETGRLFIRNLSYECTEDDLVQLFKPFGPLSEVHVPLSKTDKKPCGIAFVLYLLPENAVKAWQELDSSIFQGRLLHVLPAKSKKGAKKNEDDDDNNLSYKEKQEKNKKKSATSDHNWNLLFMRSDTVADAVSKKLRVKKSDLLSMDSDSMAVRMALSETHVIHETKTYFDDHGVNLDAFKTSGGRSNLVIIMKNIPYDIEEREISNLFGKYGDIGRIILPPTKTIAMIEFLNANEAKKAFMSLAYTKFRNVPLYLEWAPKDCLIAKSVLDSTKKEIEEEKEKEKKEEENTVEEGTTIFVKNLNFDTKDSDLKKLFKKVGKIRSVTIAKKKNPKVKGETLSMGFGFVEFSAQSEAAAAIKTMQHAKLDGHVLELKLSSRTSSSSTNTGHTSSKKSQGNVKAGTKIMVRNVPFEANPKELKELFGTFGKLKSSRIPKKFDGSHRGFAFIDFVNKQEAQSAFDALSSTHFYGRHLVLEWAKADETVEELRENTAKRFKDGASTHSNNKKLKLSETE